MTLVFKDNAKGLRSGPASTDSEFAYGFEVEMYLSDLVNRSPITTTSDAANRYDNNTRIRIMDVYNLSAQYVDSRSADVDEEMSPVEPSKEEQIYKSRKYEFISFDNIFR